MRWIKTIIKASISVALIIFILNFIDVKDLLARLKTVAPLHVGAAFILLTIQHLLSTFKWKTILRADDVKIPFKYLLKNYYISSFISLFLPSNIGGDIYRIYVLKKHSYDVYKNTSSVLFDRLTGLFALVSIAFISFALFGHVQTSRWLIVFYCAGVVLFAISTLDYTLNKLANIQNRLVSMPVKILTSFNHYIKKPKSFLLVLSIAFCFQANIVLIVSLYCAALKVSIPYSFLFPAVPLIYLTEALPITINGLGLREGAFVFFFSKAGVDAESALAVAILVITVRYLYCFMIGGSLFFITLFQSPVGFRNAFQPGQILKK